MSAGGTTAPVADERALTAQHAAELASGERFGFGANWAAFLRVLDEARIGEAERSLQAFLKV
ncbi:MAG: hypothetical protein NW201_03805, partial [Gemmatimonadales bacterium]|nr:hypothetical protein [Gemmatimonadales bacterium]